MLRREFLTLTAVITGGFLISGGILPPYGISEEQPTKPSRQRNYHLHGHARSGCASPPILAAMLENGSIALPW
jgi:hypothetical protein